MRPDPNPQGGWTMLERQMRRCFVHVGTHSTGTTTVQHVLGSRSRALEGFGFYYPRTGQPAIAPYGHHNIAWEISGDGRLRKEIGSIDDLLTEIAAVPHDVILSSEDFECSAHHPEQFASFINRLKEASFDVKLIVYFRNQIDYVEGLYLTMFRLGLAIPFREYFDEIFQSGRFRWRNWIFSFDYDEFSTRLRSFDCAELVVRSYDAVEKGALVSDFLSIVGLKSEDLAISNEVRFNRRYTTSEAVERFFRNRVGRPPLAVEQIKLAALSDAAGPRVAMSDRSRRNLIEKFSASNSRMFNVWRIPDFERMSSERIATELNKQMPMDDIFVSGLWGAEEQTLRPVQ
jgi:hypothetical protein